MTTFAQAIRLHQAGQWEEAEEIYLRIVEAVPNHVDAWHLSGMIAAQSGRCGEAVVRLQRAAELAPHIMEIQLHLGHALKAAGRRQEAAAHYRMAVACAPLALEPLLKLGVILFELGRWEEALPWLRRAWAMAPNESEIGFSLATLFVRLNLLDDAEIVLESLVDVDFRRKKVLEKVVDVNRSCLRRMSDPPLSEPDWLSNSIPYSPDIYIKSFARPFLVDRCLCSIKNFVRNYGRLVVLDDGTPPEFLKALAARHPDVTILDSGNGARNKYDFIKAHWMSADGEEILAERLADFINPAHFWASVIGGEIGGASARGRLALVLEEDQRIDRPFDLAALAAAMERRQSLMVSLAGHERIAPDSPLDVIHHDPWSYAERLSFGEQSHEFIQFYYSILSSPRPIHSEDVYFTRDIAGFLQRLIRPSSMVIDRRYFALCFGDMPAWVTEWSAQQRALEFVAEHPEKHSSGFGFACPVVRQSLFTTCRLRAQDRAEGFLSFEVNDALSAAWRAGEFDVMAGFPGDWPEPYVREILSRRTSIDGWARWRRKIVAEYQAIGATF